MLQEKSYVFVTFFLGFLIISFKSGVESAVLLKAAEDAPMTIWYFIERKKKSDSNSSISTTNYI